MEFLGWHPHLQMVIYTYLLPPGNPQGILLNYLTNSYWTGTGVIFYFTQSYCDFPF